MEIGQPPPTAALQLSSRLEQMEALVAWFDQLWPAAAPANAPEALRLQAQTALVEAFSNAVRHAHRDLPADTPIDIRWMASHDALLLEVVDQGPPFQSEAAFPELRELMSRGEAHPSQRDEHWGLLIFVRLCDRHGWQISSEQPAAGGNILRLSHPWPAVEAIPA